MKLAIFFIAFLLSTSCVIAKDGVEPSLEIKNKYRCHPWNNPSREFSQGYIQPIPIHESYELIIGGDGVLYNTGWYWKDVDLSGSHKTIGRMSATCSEYCREIYLAIDNVLYAINRDNTQYEINEDAVMWKKELKSLVKGDPTIFNDRIAILTVDNYLYMLNIENGNTSWFYHMSNGSNQMTRSNYISPVVIHDKLIVPFSNGELVAFDKDGKKLWSYKLPSTNILDTQLADITTTPVVKNNTLIATNNSTIVAIDIGSGDLLWLKAMEAKNISGGGIMPWLYPDDINGNEFFVVNTKNEVMKVAIPDGQIIWSTNLVVNDELNDKLKDAYYARPMLDGKLFIVSNKGIMFLLDEKSGMIEEIVSIPEGVYHTPATDLAVGDYYFTTEKKGVYRCIDPNISR